MMSQLRAGEDRLPALRSLGLPVLVVAGEHDMPGFVAGSRAMAEAIPGATLVVLDGAAHSPQLETPAAWAAAVAELLDVAAGSPGRDTTSSTLGREGDT